MGRQQALKKERKMRKTIEQIINNRMVKYCMKYCADKNIKFEDMDVFQKIALVREARAEVLQDIGR